MSDEFIPGMFNILVIGACFFALKFVGVAVVKPHQSHGLRALFSVLLVVLVLLIVFATFATLCNTIGTRPFSYRDWLLSFDEKYITREPPWWKVFIRNADSGDKFV